MRRLKWTRPISQDRDTEILVLSSSAQGVDMPVDTKLVFHRHGDQYFLSKIWVAGNTVSRELSISNRGREFARSTNMVETALLAKHYTDEHLFRAVRARLAFSRISMALAVQMKGLGPGCVD